MSGRTELVAVASRSWRGGCLGETETRTGAATSRTDDVAGWIQQVRAAAPSWRTQAPGPLRRTPVPRRQGP
ncbi:hypothetical protein [Streptomyces sp. TLI_053]|uniref:hypothetical protein n=1 Tax=Streptomyces sp. TLI_053 TaxID=1855352 RepID=UPI0013520998|nr:hypothetical protein [Streptomyces sp. TLI_053]